MRRKGKEERDMRRRYMGIGDIHEKNIEGQSLWNNTGQKNPVLERHIIDLTGSKNC